MDSRFRVRCRAKVCIRFFAGLLHCCPQWHIDHSSGPDWLCTAVFSLLYGPLWAMFTLRTQRWPQACYSILGDDNIPVVALNFEDSIDGECKSLLQNALTTCCVEHNGNARRRNVQFWDSGRPESSLALCLMNQMDEDRASYVWNLGEAFYSTYTAAIKNLNWYSSGSLYDKVYVSDNVDREIRHILVFVLDLKFIVTYSTCTVHQVHSLTQNTSIRVWVGILLTYASQDVGLRMVWYALEHEIQIRS